MAPGVVTDVRTPIQVIIHAPAKASGVTLKIWELDTYEAEDGLHKKEGTEDDLLAELKGEIIPGEKGTPTWRTFKVAEAKILSDDPKLARFRLKIPGHDEIFDVPIISEKAEAEGRSFEIGFSLEQGGSEKFRTKAPCFFRPKSLFPTFQIRRVREYFGSKMERSNAEIELARGYFVCVGTKQGEGLDARLDIVGFGQVDGNGLLVPATADGAAWPLPVRAERPLYFYLHREPLKETKLGPSKIPIALCTQLGDDGAVLYETFDRADDFDVSAMGAGGRGKAFKALTSLPQVAIKGFDAKKVRAIVKRRKRP
jgi:hypothetical protein